MIFQIIIDDDNASTLLRVIFVSLTSWYGIIVTDQLNDNSLCAIVYRKSIYTCNCSLMVLSYNISEKGVTALSMNFDIFINATAFLC